MTPTGLVEREREVAALAALLDAAPSGEGRVAWIEGPAGIGKSTLLAEARRHAADAGARVLAARGSELEREFPFGVVRQLFEGLLADPALRERALGGAAAPAAAVFDAPGAGDGDVSFAALHGLFWVALNLASEGPLFLAIDDLHWCDRPSLRFVAYLARRLEGQPILVAATVRTGEPGTDVALLGEIAQDPSTVAVRPVPLSADAVRELVRERLGAGAEEPFCAACHQATGGNPLFLRQLLTALEADHVRPDAEHAGVVLEIGPRAVSRTVIMRLARLSEDAIAVARAVAVLAESATLPAVAALSGLTEARVADATGMLSRAEILRREAPIGFVHALVRDAVYQELPLGERELQHERAARVLLDAGAPAEQVAAHLLSAPRRGQEWVAEQLREAGRGAVRRGAAESGVAHLQRALDEPAPAAWRPGLVLELGLAEVLTDGLAAAEHLTEAFETLDDDVPRALVAHALARALLFTGSPAEAAAFAELTASQLPAALADDSRNLTAFALMTGFFGVDAPERLQRLAAYRELPGRDAGLGAKMLAGCAGLWWAYTGGSADQCAALALASLSGGDLTVADNGLMMFAGLLTLVKADRPEANPEWAFAQSEAHRHGSLLGISSIHLWHGFALLQYGELADADESLRLAQQEFDAWGFADVARLYTASFHARTLLERGRLDDARGGAFEHAARAGRELRGQPLLALVRDRAAAGRGAPRGGAGALRAVRAAPRPRPAPDRDARALARRPGARPARSPRRGDRAGRVRARRRARVGRAGHGRPVAAHARPAAARGRAGAARGVGGGARALAVAARARQVAGRPGRRAAPRAAAERRPRAAASRARAGRRLLGRGARRARALRALRYRRATAQHGARAASTP